MWRRVEIMKSSSDQALTGCPNCEQWQRPPYGDCLNECAKRGFAPWGVNPKSSTEPTTANQLREARKLASADLKRHASVSTDNRHRCDPATEEICFCCAALTVLEERGGR